MADWYTVGTGALNMAGGLIGSAINYASQQKTNQMNYDLAQEQMAWQQQENERAFQRDLEMWDLQNQYNSPAAQRARIEAAGLNPQLAFSQGVSATSGNATNAPNLKPAQAITPEMRAYTGWNDGLNGIGDAFNRARVANANALFSEAQAADKLFELGIKEEHRDAIVKQLTANADKSFSEAKIAEAQQLILEATKEFEIQAKEAGLKLTKNQVEEVAQKILQLKEVNSLKEFRNEMRKLMPGYAFTDDFATGVSISLYYWLYEMFRVIIDKTGVGNFVPKLAPLPRLKD